MICFVTTEEGPIGPEHHVVKRKNLVAPWISPLVEDGGGGT